MRRLRFRPAGALLALLALAACTAATPAAPPADDAPAAPARPRRIVSLNLCTDQLVLALADRDQIAGLTSLVTDPAMSAEAERAHGLPAYAISSERILALDPDLVIGMPAASHPAMRALAGRYLTVDLDSAESYDAILASIRQVARAVGHPERGEAMIREMEASLAPLPRPGEGRVAAFYQQRGFLTGTGTLMDDLIVRAGYANLAARLGRGPLAQVSLEEMVAARPDVLIVESETGRVQDQGTEMLHHPALRGIPRISIPRAWTVCGGPAYVRAARLLAAPPVRP